MDRIDPRTYVLISSGQNVANLLPVLAEWRPGDRVLWLESPMARKHGWTQPAREVMERHGLMDQDSLALPSDDAHSFFESVGQWSPGVGGLVLVGNGGTKTQCMAVALALQQRQGRSPTLYNSDRVVAYEWMPEGPTGPTHLRTYPRMFLSLDDLLHLRGYMRVKESGTRIWPEPKDIPDTQYSQDINYTIELHDGHARWKEPIPDDATSQWPLEIPAFEEVQRLGGKWYESWRSGVIGQTRACEIKDAQLRSIYYSTAKLMRKVRVIKTRDGIPRPDQIGREFEKAVVRRLLTYLAGQVDIKEIIGTIDINIKIVQCSDPWTVAAELDIAMLLRNGLLYCLECKSHSAQTKDLDARLLGLQQMASLLAQIAICGPLYTDYQEKQWFHAQHEFKQRIVKLSRYHFVPFDLPNQRTDYTIETADGVQKFECETFETALNRWLLRLVPKRVVRMEGGA